MFVIEQGYFKKLSRGEFLLKFNRRLFWSKLLRLIKLNRWSWGSIDPASRRNDLRKVYLENGTPDLLFLYKERLVCTLRPQVSSKEYESSASCGSLSFLYNCAFGKITFGSVFWFRPYLGL